MKISIPCEIKSGHLIVPNRAAMQAQLAHLPDGPVTLEIKTGTRSQAANRTYWLYLTMISEVTGHTPEELHETYKAMFNSRTVSAVGESGSIVDVKDWAASTTALDSEAFSIYVRHVRQHAAEFFGIILPDPLPSSEADPLSSPRTRAE